MKLPQSLANLDVLLHEELPHEVKDAVKAQRLATLVAKAKAVMHTDGLAVVVFKLPKRKP